MWVFFISLLIVFEAIADILAKEFQINNTWIWFVAAILAYVVANVFWLFSLKSGAGLTKGAIIFSVGSAILAIVVGLLLYKEPITKLQIAGSVMGLFSLLFLTWEGD